MEITKESPKYLELNPTTKGEKTMKLKLMILTLVMIVITGVTIQAASYKYDELGRLTNAYYSSGQMLTYVYDAGGNIESVTLGTYTDTTAPTVPTGLTALEVTSQSLVLRWTPSTDDVAVQGYEIYQDGVLVCTTAATQIEFTGLSSETTYSYTIKAYDEAGNTTVESSALNVTTLQLIIGF